MTQILESIALILTPIAAMVGAGLAYRAKVLSRETRDQLDTGNGHTIGQAVARVEEEQAKQALAIAHLSERIYRNAEEVSKLRTAQVEHQIAFDHKYKHEWESTQGEEAL